MALKHSITWAANGAKITGNNWNADHIVDAGGMTMLATDTPPSAPDADSLKLWARKMAGRSVPAFTEQNGMNSFVQPFFGTNKICMISGQGNGSWTFWGYPGGGGFGGGASRTQVWDNLFKSMRRNGLATGSGANFNGNWRMTAAGLGLPGTAGMGGFTIVTRFGTCNYIADGRVIIGLSPSSGSMGTATPSSQINCILMGYDPGDTTWSIFHNDSTGTATKLALGSNFPCNTVDTDMYELVLFAAPGARSVTYTVRRLNTGHSANGVITTDLPDASVYLNFHYNMATGANVGITGVDLVGLYVETDS